MINCLLISVPMSQTSSNRFFQFLIEVKLNTSISLGVLRLTLESTRVCHSRRTCWRRHLFLEERSATCLSPSRCLICCGPFCLAAGKTAPAGVLVSMMNNHDFDLNELPPEHEQLVQEQPPVLLNSTNLVTFFQKDR